MVLIQKTGYRNFMLRGRRKRLTIYVSLLTPVDIKSLRQAALLNFW